MLIVFRFINKIIVMWLKSNRGVIWKLWMCNVIYFLYFSYEYNRDERIRLLYCIVVCFIIVYYIVLINF